MIQRSDHSISENALRVLAKRYLAKDEAGVVIETPEALFRRVAQNIAQAERLYDAGADIAAVEEEFYRLFSELKFLPNSPTLMNAGRDLQQLSACFVLPVEDSMEGIFDAIKHTAIIHKTGGGTGFSFSRLRPKNDLVRTTGGVASGPISFMKVFNHATEAVKQGGTRRGANMGILRVDHPDILEFIRCKEDTREITNFNISVAVTDAFMEAFEKGGDYGLINPRTGERVGTLPACEVLDRIAVQAHKTGEPGLFFIDRANEVNPTPHAGIIEATNPCGEQPLLPYESCNLGSINLERHLVEVDTLESVAGASGQYRLDWAALEKSVRTAVRFLDNVIDMNRYPIEEIERITKANRKIGLGVMGFARMLFKLAIPYGSERGIEAAKTVMNFIRETGCDESVKLAERRGVYPNWKGSLHEKRGEKIRNAYVTTVAPTGTISMIADTSGGCEPEFSLIWYKNVLDGERLPYVLDYFIEVAKKEGFWSDDLLDQIVKNHGSLQGLSSIPEKWREIFVVSHDIAPEWHVRMQAAFQSFSDSAVSKTINLPSSATVEEVKKAYLLAYRLGCKGITVYRDGARVDQVMNVGVIPQNTSDNGGMPATESKKEDLMTSELPDLIPELRIKVKTKRGNSYVHVGFLIKEESMGDIFETLRSDGSIRELFLSPSPHVKNRELLDMVCRLGSKLLRAGSPIEEVLEQLVKSNDQFGDISSDAYALVKGLTTVVSRVQGATTMQLPCPECGVSPLRMQEGCLLCGSCSWTKC
ncbi:vitamin B12-dependent ribonucleotide reductase [Candidatus Manganitrophus noduliformans]|uniref:Vitamin B12-dependent ribonucleotide reductase n=1 Tax=Candidatus Manganitrophus noduliformans TaxID=2606439 RepID=A0A7X6DN02_9BACT|nr:vitamin B12-dependent ribonucleotide reductase [Candidatus Manganitrophus noduliformans]NKE70190.1 vitamin B12-dependent ribonucleotide reductase [Candidatus Manganitrophus noduliformans]